MAVKVKIVCLVLLSLFVLSCQSDDDSTGPSENTVVIVDNAFTPSSITVAVGRMVAWRNQGSNPHTVTSGIPGSPAAGTLFDSGSIPAGSGYNFTFSAAGSYPYFCRLHGAAMTGVVNVR